MRGVPAAGSAGTAGLSGGLAIPPWDLLGSPLDDLARDRGSEFAARERQYAQRLRAAAVAAWDRLPGGERELRSLLAPAATALAGAGRTADCEALLRQGVARPPAEVADAALALAGAGRPAEVDALLGATGPHPAGGGPPGLPGPAAVRPPPAQGRRGALRHLPP